jgi:zinc protease
MAKAAPESVRDAARRWLSDGVYALHIRPFPRLAAAGADADRSKAPGPGAPPEPSFPAFTRHRLANGLPVIVAERHAVPVVGIQLIADAGYASDPGGAPGTARLAGDMLAEGAGKRSSEQIAEELAQLGAQLAVYSDLDTTNLTLSALREKLDPSLALLAEVALRPTFPEADVARRREMQLASIGREETDPGALALRVLPRLLYGPGHAYAQPFTGSGTREVVAKLTRADLVRWHETWFRPGSATLVVVGDATAAEILPRLERLFGGWKGGAAPAKNVGAAAPPGKGRLYLLDRPGAPQSFVIGGQLFPPRANPGEIAQGIMNTVLGGQFASRVNANLREEKHWSYGAYTRIADARGPRPFLATAPVQTDRTKEALAELRKELAAIRSDRPITAEELSAAKVQRTLTLPGRWEASSAVGQSLAELVRFGFADDYPATYAGKVRALSLSDVAEAARLVEPDRLVWVVVGDRAKVEAGLGELGLGEPVLLDADGNPAR